MLTLCPEGSGSPRGCCPLPRARPVALGSAWALCLGLALGALPGVATGRSGRPSASPGSVCKIHVINGLKVPGKFPASLSHMRRRLKAQPFKVFLSFKLLRISTLKLAQGRLARARLAGPYRLEGQLLSVLLGPGGKQRLRFELALYRRRTRFKAARRMLKTTLVLDRGGTFFFVGPPHKGGKLIIGITCR